MMPYILYIKTLALCVLISFVFNEELLAQVSLDLGNKYYVSSERQNGTTYKNTLKNNNDEGYFLLGTIASKEEICSLFKHPVFSKEKFQGYNDVNYVYIPIDRIIEEFVSMLPFSPTNLGMYSEDKYKWATRGELFKLKTYVDLGERIPDMTSTCLPIDLFQNEKDSWGYNSLPLIVWQEAYKDTYPHYPIMTHGITITTGIRIITDKRNLRDINIYALLLLKEMHPALIKRFDELHQIELERLIEIEARNLELEKVKLRLETQRKEWEKQREQLRKEKEKEREQLAVEAEKDRLIWMKKLRLQEKESEERISRAKFWDKVQANILYFLSFAFVIYIFILIKRMRIEGAKKKRLEAQKIEAEEKEKEKIAFSKEAERKRIRDFKNQERLRVNRRKRWEKKIRTIQREINYTKESIENINKQYLPLNKQIEKLESEKKSIEDNIKQLNDDIKGEKKIVKKLREKYPFIDVYIENR